jgi:DNA adenine methylase
MHKSPQNQVPTPEMSSPITYYGGKKRMLRHILPLIPSHTTYCEPFVGGAAVFFAKKRSHVEIINDTNRFVVNFYRQCQMNFDALQERIRMTLHARSAYDDAMDIYRSPDHLCYTDLDKAWAFWVTTNMGFACSIGTWGYGTEDNKRENSICRKRENFTQEVSDRLKTTQIDCRDALYVIQMRDRVETFYYCDPPYFNSNMGHYGGYTESDFRNLLTVLSEIKGKFLLSSYPSELLTEFIKRHGWKTKTIDTTIAASRKRKAKTEVLTWNYDETAVCADLNLNCPE